MGATNGIEVLFGAGGGTLSHLKAVANSVKPAQITALAQVFAEGSTVSSRSHLQLESSVDAVVTGWKGQAAGAASTTVLGSALSSRESAHASATAQRRAVAYAEQVTTSQAKINAIPEVDTSVHAAVAKSGGTAVPLLAPHIVAGHLAAAQARAVAHREQAARHLNDMDEAGRTMAASMGSTYTPITAPPNSHVEGLPRTLEVHPAAHRPDRLHRTLPQPPPSSTGQARHPIVTHHGTQVISARGPHGASTPPRTSQVPDGPGTQATGYFPPSGSGGPAPTPTPLPGPVHGPQGPVTGGPIFGGPIEGAPIRGGGGGGREIGRVIEGNGGNGGGGRGGQRGGQDEPRSGARPGSGGAPDEDATTLRNRPGSGLTGSRGRGPAGFGDAAAVRGGGATGPGQLPMGGRGGVGALGEETPLRASTLGSTAGDLAAGERGLNPAGGAGRRRDDDDELNKRPDYLVESDDIWGDGRLAAPPVLG